MERNSVAIFFWVGGELSGLGPRQDAVCLIGENTKNPTNTRIQYGYFQKIGVFPPKWMVYNGKPY